MPTLYFTPATLGYLAQFILVLLIVGYFVVRLRRTRASRPAVHQTLLTGFFACIALLTLLFTLDASFSPSNRLLPLYLETTVLALSIVLLLQFTYRFPEPYSHKWEAQLVLALSLVYLLFEAGYAVYRFHLLAIWGWVIFRPPWADYPMALGFLWAPIVLLRQAIRANLTGSWRLQGQAATAARDMALIYLLPFAASLLNILRSFYYLPPELFQIILSIGMMVTLAAFAVVYLNTLPETITFMVRLVGVAVVALLTVLSAVGWLITPTYAADYRPTFPAQRTLRFTPNAAGGYDISLAPFHFERDPSAGPGQGLGVNLGLRDAAGPAERATERSASARLAFTFPFYGRAYDTVYIHNDGAIAIGRNVRSPWVYPDYTYHHGSYTPFLFPLLLDLIPEAGEAGSGVYARQEADRLIVTWERVPAFRRRQNVFTFQAVLYASGVFEFSYDRLPADLVYRPDDEPSASIWVIGATSPPTPLLAGQGRGKIAAPQYVDFGRLASDSTAIIASGPQGVLQDYYLDFRRHLHALLWPLAYLIIVTSAAAVIGFTTVFHRNLVQSLESLLAGVRRVNAGDLGMTIPIHYHDEIGFLTESFNSATARLRDQVTTLETHVAERTADLTVTNARLRQEIDQRQGAQAQVVVQERALAAVEEREHMSRELHDGLGQVMGYINVQLQAVQVLLTEGQTAAAQTNLRQMTQAAQDAHTDIRNYILGLRRPATPSGDFRETLEAYLRQFSESYGIRASLSYPDDSPCAPFAPAVEEQVVRIAQEALANVRKHAAATRVEVIFNSTDEQAQMIIVDDGVGFPHPSPQPSPHSVEGDAPLSPSTGSRQALVGKGAGGEGHFGLSVMRERAAQVGGRLEVRSAPGRGTEVLLTVPCLASQVGEQSDVSAMRVLLADDHPLFLDGLRNLLLARGINVIGLAHDGLEAQELARDLRPNLIIMDLQMPRCNGLEAVQAIKAEMPEVRIVMLTVSEKEDDLFQAIKAGASGYLLKSLDANKLVALLSDVMRGEAPLPPALAVRLVADLTAASAREDEMRGGEKGKESAPAELTPRQWEILNLVVRGMTYKEIGATLHLTEEGVKYHMGRILDRLHLVSREEAIAYARRRADRAAR